MRKPRIYMHKRKDFIIAYLFKMSSVNFMSVLTLFTYRSINFSVNIFDLILLARIL